MKKKIVFSTIAASLAVSLCAGSVLLSKRIGNKQFQADADVTPIVVGSTQFAASSLTTSYQQEVTQEFPDKLVTLHYSLAKKVFEDDVTKLVLAPTGKLFNYSTTGTHGQITNLTSMTVNYTGGSLSVEEGAAGGSTYYEKRQNIVSGTPVNFVSKPNHIMISNSGAETKITSISFVYTCNAATYDIGRFSKYYRGQAADSTVYTLEINGTAATFNGLDGVLTADNSGGFTLKFLEETLVITGTVSADYNTLTFTGVSGSNAALAPSIATMNRVYVVDDFEKYNATGTTFGPKTQPESIFSVSGLRGEYYSDYGGGGNNTWISGSDFQIPTSSDFLLLNTDYSAALKHGGDKSMILKASTGGWMRYWNREIFDQNQHYTFGRGNYLSFWAYQPVLGNGNNSEKGVKVTVQAYYQNFEITDGNRKSTTYGTGPVELLIQKAADVGSGWKEYTIPLDPARDVYALNFMVDNSTVKSYQNAYIAIDDITIGTVSQTKQVAEGATKLTKTYHGSVSTLAGTYTVKVAFGANGHVYGWAGDDMKPTNYVLNGDQITIYTTGDLNGYKFGTWTGTLSAGGSVLTVNKSNISGSIKNVINSSSIVLEEDTVWATGEEADDTTLQALFRRQYNGGSWTDDPGNYDRLTRNTDYCIEGTHAIKVRAYKDGGMRIFLEPDAAESIGTIESVAFWVYAPYASKYHLKVFAYDNYDPMATGAKFIQLLDARYSGSNPGWKYFNLGIVEENAAYRKNFAIFVDSTSTPTYLDYITFF